MKNFLSRSKKLNSFEPNQSKCRAKKACGDGCDTLRYLWVLGSFVSIYSRSKNKWFIGEITDIYIDDIIKEWFIVKYNGNKKNQCKNYVKIL